MEQQLKEEKPKQNKLWTANHLLAKYINAITRTLIMFAISLLILGIARWIFGELKMWALLSILFFSALVIQSLIGKYLMRINIGYSIEAKYFKFLNKYI